MLERTRETISGCLELCRLGAITGFRFRSPYWKWRWQTAMGPGPKPSRGEVIRRLIRYGAWCRKMRTGGW